MSATVTRPTWAHYWTTVGNESYLLVKRILEATNGVVARDAAQWITGEQDRGADLDWAAWFTDVADQGRGWSSTEHRVFQLVRALLWPWEHPDSAEIYDEHLDRWHAPPPPLDLNEILGQLGSWETEIWTALVEWGTNGRLTTTGGSR